MSIWNDATQQMAWLDAGANGPCASGAGSPSSVSKQQGKRYFLIQANSSVSCLSQGYCSMSAENVSRGQSLIPELIGRFNPRTPTHTSSFRTSNGVILDLLLSSTQHHDPIACLS